MVLRTELQSEVDFDPTHIDAIGTLDNPAIIAATLVSTCLLILALTKASKSWQSLNGWNTGRRILLLFFGCTSYLVAAWIQILLGEAFYRLYTGLDSSVSVGLYVPVVPVWFMATIAVVIFHVIRSWQKGRVAQY